MRGDIMPKVLVVAMQTHERLSYASSRPSSLFDPALVCIRPAMESACPALVYHNRIDRLAAVHSWT